MQYGFFQDMEKGTKEASEAAGYDYVLVDQKSSESTMVSATQDLIDQGINALIISPFKPDALGPIVDAAKAKKIPVVVDDIGGGGTDYDVIVISDNDKGGVIAADQIAAVLKERPSAAKKVASISCEPSAVYAARRNAGFEKRIKELGYTVVASLSANSKQEEGYKVAKDVLSAHPDVAAIFCGNDPMAVGAAQAVADSGKSGVKDVYVVGFNGDEIALQAIKAGQMGATIQQVPEEMGKMTVQLATKLMNGEKLQYNNAEKREIYVPVKLITAADLGASSK
jgi:ribose transport system substrate-binding protein